MDPGPTAHLEAQLNHPRKEMKPQVFLRILHRWGSMVIALPLAITVLTGVLLLIKKESAWIQPPTQKGAQRNTIPTQSFTALFEAARSVSDAGIHTWADLDRVDIKPGKGIIKFVSRTRWEVQVDTHTAKILQVAYRRSDLIEALHDGSWFFEGAKLGIWLPSAAVLIGLWMTGVYLFALPHYRRWRRRKPLS